MDTGIEQSHTQNVFLIDISDPIPSTLLLKLYSVWYINSQIITITMDN